MKEQVSTTTIDKLVPDDKNFNRGTEYGKKLLGKSFGQFGAGRSILIDKNNRIIAGNKATEEYGEQGGEKVIVVETDGKTLVAVKRTDIDLDSKRGRELALADNATQKADLEWDTQVMDEVAKEWGIDSVGWGVPMWEADNATYPDDYGEEFTLPDGDKEPFQQMTFTLADAQAEEIKQALEDVKHLEEYKAMITYGNANTNGNAISYIVEQWIESRK